jgi:hypothetical protein
LSPDGKFFWNGQSWVPTPDATAEASVGGTSGKAVTALVLGILWVFGLGSLLAIIFGFIGRRDIKKDPRLGGAGMATAGFVLGIVGLIGAVLTFVFLVAVGSGIQSTAAVNNTLISGSIAELDFSVRNLGSGYTSDPSELAAYGFRPAAGVSFTILRADRSSFCLSASKGGTHEYWNSNGGLTSTSCQ